MFTDPKNFVIQGGTFIEHHFHGTTTDPTTPEVLPVQIPESISESLPPSQYQFQNCDNPNSCTTPALIRYVDGTPGVAEVLEVGMPGKAWAVSGSVLTVSSNPSRLYFERIHPDSEWYRICTFQKPRKVLTGHVIAGSKYGDMVLEEKTPLVTPIQLWKPIKVNAPFNSGLLFPGQYIFVGHSGGTQTKPSLVKYRDGDVPGIAEIAITEPPGLFWSISGNVIDTTKIKTEWHFEMEDPTSTWFYIYPRNQPNKVLANRSVGGSDELPLEDKIPSSPRHLWKAVRRDVPDTTGAILPGKYTFLNWDHSVHTNPTHIKYLDNPEPIGVATLSLVSEPHKFWVANEGSLDIGTLPGKWYFETTEKVDVYYIYSIDHPGKVITGLLVDGEPTFLLLEKDPGTAGQLWKALKNYL